MTIGVRATRHCKQSFMHLMDDLFGTMRLQMLVDTSVSCSAQSVSICPVPPSGPAVFEALVFYKAALTWWGQRTSIATLTGVCEGGAESSLWVSKQEKKQLRMSDRAVSAFD